MKSVYSAVRTGSLNKAICALCVKGLIIVNTTGMPHLIIIITSQGHFHKYEDPKKENIQMQCQNIFFKIKYSSKKSLTSNYKFTLILLIIGNTTVMPQLKINR
jgi:hypothetical protein